MTENLGVKVTLKRYYPEVGEVNEVLRNVTEIHYNYQSCNKPSNSVAFESSIHGSGITCEISAIVEFETIPETEVADSF